MEDVLRRIGLKGGIKMYSVFYYSCPKTGYKYFFLGDIDRKTSYHSKRFLMHAAFIVKDKSGVLLKDRGIRYPLYAGAGL